METTSKAEAVPNTEFAFLGDSGSGEISEFVLVRGPNTVPLQRGSPKGYDSPDPGLCPPEGVPGGEANGSAVVDD